MPPSPVLRALPWPCSKANLPPVGLLLMLLAGLAGGTAAPALGQALGTVEGRVVDAETNEPLAGVNVVVPGTQTGAATGPDGTYRLELESGMRRLRASYVGYGAEERRVEVQAGQTTTVDFALVPGSTLDDVVVIGSRGAPRSALESPVPVDAIAVDEVTALAPQDDLNQLLTYAVPSFQSNRQSSADATEFIDPVSLRGLGPDQVLVLVNGKRRHKSALVNTLQTAGNGAAGTDLNAIPVAAIERIEVLRDGAAAQYGSDAIAGVINVVLKEQTGTLSANVTGGIHQEGDGENLQIGANYGFDLGEEGFVNVTGEFTDRARTNRADGSELIIFDQSAYGNFFSYPGEGEEDARRIDNRILEERGLEREDFHFRVGQSAMQRASVMLNSEYGLGENATLYAFGGLTYKNGIGAPFRRLPSETSANVPAIYPNGFQPELNSDLVDQSLTVGVEGSLQDWTLDLSNTFGRNTLAYQVDNTVNASLGAASPTSIYAGRTAFSQNTTNLDVTRFFEAPLAGINLAFGTAYRVDHYEIGAGEEASYRNYGRVQVIEGGQLVTRDTLGKAGGAQGFVGFRPGSETRQTRTNVAAYADAEVNLTETLLVTAAGRFEHYSDFGSTLNGKLSARLSLLDEVLNLRGSASTGFRAPSLHQIYYDRVTEDLTNGELTEVGTFPNKSQVARVLGIPPLEEENSRNASLGLTASPLANLDITVDGYYIEVDDRILLTGTFGSSEAIAALLDEVNATDARFFANAVDTETSGLDVVATYRVAPALGDFDFSAAFNYNETEAVSVHVPPLLEGQEETFFGDQEEALLEDNAPRTTLNLQADYARGPFSALVRTVRFGEVTRDGSPFGSAQVHSAEWVVDLGLSYRLTEGVSLAVGANNVFDNLPDEQIFGNSYLGVFDYAPVQQGFNGAFYFARLNLRL